MKNLFEGSMKVPSIQNMFSSYHLSLRKLHTLWPLVCSKKPDAAVYHIRFCIWNNKDIGENLQKVWSLSTGIKCKINLNYGKARYLQSKRCNARWIFKSPTFAIFPRFLLRNPAKTGQEINFWGDAWWRLKIGQDFRGHNSK